MTRTMTQTQAKQRRSLPRSKKAARIAIAQDVIKRINTFGSIESTYLEVDTDMTATIRRTLGLKNSDIDGREHFESIAPACAVCAKGALFMCHVDIFDKFSLADLSREKGDRAVCSPLLNHFTQRQLDLIETAFEKGPQGYAWVDKELHKLPKRRARCGDNEVIETDYSNWIRRSYLPPSQQPMVYQTDTRLIPDVKAAVKFGKRFRNRKNCLKAICQNIVDNDGTFQP